jgi:hypothetical protein
MSARDEFYIGYEGETPHGIRRVVQRAVFVAITGVLVAAAVATTVQRPLPQAEFEFGRTRTFRGWLVLEPIPTLHVLDDDRHTRYWLVAPGKFGADSVIAGHEDGGIELEATVITREHWQMLEVVPGSLRRIDGAGARPSSRPVAGIPLRARGEVVDSKCFLGVMNPGQHVAHRDCAVRCVSGGVPPMFWYVDEDGRSRLALLLWSSGTTPAPWPALSGTTIEIAGTRVTDEDVEVIAVEAAW